MTILYPLTLNYKRLPFYKKVRGVAGIIKNLVKGYSPDGWFTLNPKVHQRWVLSLNQNHVPGSDIYVATAVETAYYLKSYDFPREKIVYLIQNFEKWALSEAEVLDSFRFGFKNIVISKWLKKIVEGSGASCEYLKNGFDFDYFRYSVPVEQREAHSLAMMYHVHPSKGSADGLEALRLLKNKYPDMKVRMFSSYKRPEFIEKWIEYYRLPDKKTHNYVYNSCSVFLATSLYEGWGLPVGEAMMCGAAVVCTDTDGYKEMVEDGANGIIVPVGDVRQMVEKVSELFDNRDRRIELALKGHATIQSFTWESSTGKLIDLIEEIK